MSVLFWLPQAWRGTENYKRKRIEERTRGSPQWEHENKSSVKDFPALLLFLFKFCGCFFFLKKVYLLFYSIFFLRLYLYN